MRRHFQSDNELLPVFSPLPVTMGRGWGWGHSALLFLENLHKNPLDLPYSPNHSHGKVGIYPKFAFEFGIYLYWTRLMPNLTDLYKLDQFNDTFALGHYARVLDAQDRR